MRLTTMMKIQGRTVTRTRMKAKVREQELERR